MIVRDIVYRANENLQIFSDIDNRLISDTKLDVIQNGLKRELVGVWINSIGLIYTLDSFNKDHTLNVIGKNQVVDLSYNEIKYVSDNPFLHICERDRPIYFILLNNHELGTLLDLTFNDLLLYCKITVESPQHVVDVYNKV